MSNSICPSTFISSCSTLRKIFHSLALTYLYIYAEVHVWIFILLYYTPLMSLLILMYKLPLIWPWRPLKLSSPVLFTLLFFFFKILFACLTERDHR